MARSLNKAEIIGNLTRDPELRYTPSGTAVCTFSIATNRYWTTDTGEKKEETDFHRIVAWNKLAELCSQFLVKGRKVYVQGRISNRSYTAQDGQQRNITEIVIDDMILLDNKGSNPQGGDEVPPPVEDEFTEEKSDKKESLGKKEPKKSKKEEQESSDEEINPDDIPF